MTTAQLTSDNSPAPAPKPGSVLCLSGGGYRAMIFHVGVLWRLNEAGVLSKLDRISSVSGGSITAGVLGLNWSSLDFQGGVANNFGPRVVDPLRKMAHTNVDVTSVLSGIGLPFSSIADRVIKAYRNTLFGKATLQDLPDNPRFVFNATNLQTGTLFRMSKPYLRDYRLGKISTPDLPLAVAVGASSAFPPFLSPCTLDLRHENWELDEDSVPDPEFREDVQLSDGGVYDNLALETAKEYQTILASDAGGAAADDAHPPRNWAGHILRVLSVIDRENRAQRKRQLVADFQAGVHKGMYVGTHSAVADFGLADPMEANPTITEPLADLATRLDRMDDGVQEQLINWGYTIADTGLRRWVDTTITKGQLPYPAHPLN